MELTRKQKNKLRLISDGELYKEAMQFIKDNGTTSNAQIKGLENIARASKGISSILAFARHQKSKERDYSAFYSSFIKKLEEIQTRYKDSYGFIPEGISKKEYKEYYGLLLAREFIYHLAPENIFMEDYLKYLKIVGLGRSSQRRVSVSEQHDKYLSKR